LIRSFCHAGQCSQWLFGQTLEQTLDLIAHSVGGRCFSQNLQQGGEQEFLKPEDQPSLSEAASAA
jgi:hypothetical protein